MLESSPPLVSKTVIIIQAKPAPLVCDRVRAGCCIRVISVLLQKALWGGTGPIVTQGLRVSWQQTNKQFCS